MSMEKMVCGLHNVPSVDDIVGIRHRFGLTQAEFADLLGVSRHTVQSWELHRGTPSGASKKTLNMLMAKPEVVYELLKAA